ncbi:MAG: hypothetical protein M8357_15970 [Desulfobulbaceae bacterium]|nr:hypothetical protein [Desulfobulbaceae bacterium]
MKTHRAPGWILLFTLALLFLQSGCASKIPASFPLAENKKPFVLDQLRQFRDRDCPQSLDADVTLEWTIYGKTEKIPGVLQLQSPAFLRYSVVDPLGRQLFILAGDGSSFTLVDNRKAKALTGRTDSAFWQKYIPDFISPSDYMHWLAGRLPAADFAVEEIRGDSQSPSTFWLITQWRGNIRHHVLFHLESSRISRHIVENDKGEVLLDVSYTDYGPNDPDCPHPHLLLAKGAEIKGTVQLRFDRIFPPAPIPERIFHLTLPDHFTVKTVD